MAINDKLIVQEEAAAAAGNAGEEGLILHLDANDVDSYDGDGTEWVDITNHEYTPATNVSEHFNTVLYTGNGGTNEITGVGFQPDLVWIKSRSSTASHGLVDSIRGNNSVIFSNSTSAESTLTGGNLSMDADGFDINTYGSSWANASSQNYVAWCLKAGGAAVSNTDGSITSQVSANNDLGFSVAKYTGSGSAGATVGHGLDVQPEMIIVKDLDNTSDWAVYSYATGNTKKLLLNSDLGASTSGVWNNTSPTSSVFTVRYSQTDEVNHDFTAYCFASKRGVSKVGSYIGDGGTNNKIYTGFEPAFVMIKNTTTSGYNWNIVDNKRGNNQYLLAANTSSAEETNETPITFNRDGFTIDIASDYINKSGNNFIYYAVAKNTNETSLIPDTDLELHLDAASFDGSTNTPTTWIDSANSYNGTITEAVFDSELGNWLDFDGVNDEVNWSTFPTAFQTLTAITMELWVKFDTVSGTQYPIWLGRAASGKSVNIGLVGGKIQTWVGTVGYPSLFTPVANKWYHLAVTISGSTQTVYVDGEDYTNSSSTQGISMDSNAGNVFLLGDYSGGTADFNGKIGQVRIYSSALTQDQIRQNFNFTKNDYPNGFDGAISGATWNSGGYFSFDGSNDKVTLPYTDNPSNATFSAWVNCNNVSTYNNFISKGYYSGSTNTNYFYLSTYATPYPEFRVRLNGTSIAATSSVAISNNTWHHLVGTVSGTGDLQIYVDGTLRGSATGAPARNMTQSIIVGAYFSGALQFFDGEMSKIKLYDKVLTSSEITALYNEGE